MDKCLKCNVLEDGAPCDDCPYKRGNTAGRQRDVDAINAVLARADGVETAIIRQFVERFVG